MNIFLNSRWPNPPENWTRYLLFEDVLPQGYFHRLPLEILLDIAADLPISTMLMLSTTCRFLRNLFVDTEVLNAILRQTVLSRTGPLRYV